MYLLYPYTQIKNKMGRVLFCLSGSILIIQKCPINFDNVGYGESIYGRWANSFNFFRVGHAPVTQSFIISLKIALHIKSGT
jgi:hypothetical protein